MSYDPSAGQSTPPGGPDQPDTPPTPGYGAPDPYPAGGSPYGTPGYGAPVDALPSTYRAWAVTCIVLGILFSLIIGLPMGIVANHYAGRVQRNWDMGDQEGAMRASSRARLWAILSTVFIVLGFIGFIIVVSHHSSTTS